MLLVIGVFTAMLVYKFVLYAFKKFKLIELIDKLTIDFEDITNIPDTSNDTKAAEKKPV